MNELCDCGVMWLCLWWQIYMMDNPIEVVARNLLLLEVRAYTCVPA